MKNQNSQNSFPGKKKKWQWKKTYNFFFNFKNEKKQMKKKKNHRNACDINYFQQWLKLLAPILYFFATSLLFSPVHLSIHLSFTLCPYPLIYTPIIYFFVPIHLSRHLFFYFLYLIIFSNPYSLFFCLYPLYLYTCSLLSTPGHFFTCHSIRFHPSTYLYTHSFICALKLTQAMTRLISSLIRRRNAPNKNTKLTLSARHY